jgi:phage-related protein
MSQPQTWQVEFYEDSNGTRPVDDWLRMLAMKDQARVERTIGLLATYGIQLPMPHSRHVSGKIFELRVASGRRDYRILYFAFVGRRFVLLHAFAKQTQATPAREITIAERRWADYLARHHEGGML